MKRKVNIHYISRLFDPLFSLSDQDIDNLSHLDLKKEPETKLFFEENILANFKRYGPKSNEMVRNTLSYIIGTKGSKYSFEDIFPYGNIPVEEPDDIVLFLTWIWDSLFSGDKIEECNDDDFVINNDYNAPNSVYIR